MLRDVMKETWAFQNTALEGHEEELPQRFQMAFMQGIHQAHSDLIVKMSIAQTAEEAVVYLLEIDEDEDEED